MHIDDWLDLKGQGADNALVAWFEAVRMPAATKIGGYPRGSVMHPSGLTYAQWIDSCLVTCTFRKRTMRCVGASRLGDVWLTPDLKRTAGYAVRPNIDECSDWLIVVPPFPEGDHCMWHTYHSDSYIRGFGICGGYDFSLEKTTPVTCPKCGRPVQVALDQEEFAL